MKEHSMKPRFVLSLFVILWLLVASGTSAALGQSPGAPEALLGTAFTYQGRLGDSSIPANGSFDFQFILYNAESGGAQVGSTVVKEDVAVSNGYFTVLIDFGGGAFGPDARWLEIGTRPGASGGSFTILSPRQQLTPVPSALYASSANSAPWGGLTGVPTGFADGVDNNTTYTAGTGLALVGTQFSLAGAYSLPQGCGNGQIPQWTGSAWVCSSTWGLTGNAGTNPATNYLGTSDNQPLVLKVNGQRVLRFEPITTAVHGFAPNLLGGFGGNTITAGVSGVTIAGGGKSGWLNWVTDDFGTIGGGLNNQAGDNSGDFLSAPAATVAGGSGNKASGDAATVSGGWGNTASNAQSTVGGGAGNTASGNYAAVPGGSGNTAAGNYSLAAGYNANTTAAAAGSFVWADSTGATLTSSTPNEFRVRVANGVRFTTNSMDGLMVDNSALSTNGDGIHSSANVSLGSSYAAVYAYNAGTSPGIYARSTGTYAGYFSGDIYSTGCVGCAIIYVAQNTGSDPLETGDVTAAAGLGEALSGTETPVIQVQRAASGESVVGVVLGKAVIAQSSQDGLEIASAEKADGPAAPGDYVFIVVQGLAYVKADATNAAIVTGQRLTASSQAGLARALETRTLEGMTVAEAAPAIGIALAPLDTGTGLIPVMVTLR
jgi:hypothetical protein